MTDLPPLLTEALEAIGIDTEARMGDLIIDFAAFPLSEEDRLSVLAGTVATIAVTRYARHRHIFIAALQSWALEISIALLPPPPRMTQRSTRGPIEDAQDVLLNGIDDILYKMIATGSAKHHRLVTELAIMARLLGRYDSRSIYQVLTAASGACADPIWSSGEAVPVLLGDGWLSVSAKADLAITAPHGTA
jgi:hypothetical protein